MSSIPSTFKNILEKSLFKPPIVIFLLAAILQKKDSLKKLLLAF
jgi:hypothetical protein